MVVIVRGTTDELSGFDIALASMTKIVTKAKLLERTIPNQTEPPAAAVDGNNGASLPEGGVA
jgi:hypothetical protein